MMVELCGACAAKYREAGIKIILQPARTSKITCHDCNRRRYGSKYEIYTAVQSLRDKLEK